MSADTLRAKQLRRLKRRLSAYPALLDATTDPDRINRDLRTLLMELDDHELAAVATLVAMFGASDVGGIAWSCYDQTASTRYCAACRSQVLVGEWMMHACDEYSGPYSSPG